MMYLSDDLRDDPVDLAACVRDLHQLSVGDAELLRGLGVRVKAAVS
jgi:hypothetical protein